MKSAQLDVESVKQSVPTHRGLLQVMCVPLGKTRKDIETSVLSSPPCMVFIRP